MVGHFETDEQLGQGQPTYDGGEWFCVTDPNKPPMRGDWLANARYFGTPEAAD